MPYLAHGTDPAPLWGGGISSGIGLRAARRVAKVCPANSSMFRASSVDGRHCVAAACKAQVRSANMSLPKRAGLRWMRPRAQFIDAQDVELISPPEPPPDSPGMGGRRTPVELQRRQPGRPYHPTPLCQPCAYFKWRAGRVQRLPFARRTTLAATAAWTRLGLGLDSAWTAGAFAGLTDEESNLRSNGAGSAESKSSRRREACAGCAQHQRLGWRIARYEANCREHITRLRGVGRNEVASGMK
jgi:hypothetical protein